MPERLRDARRVVPSGADPNLRLERTAWGRSSGDPRETVRDEAAALQQLAGADDDPLVA